MKLILFLRIFISMQVCFLRLVLLMLRYKYFLVILIIVESVIINISMLVVFNFRRIYRAGVIFVYLFNF